MCRRTEMVEGRHEGRLSLGIGPGRGNWCVERALRLERKMIFTSNLK